jgi:hypothetical protein
MKELLNKGYAEIIPNNEVHRNDGAVWYLPHHPVLHDKKPDKVRIVFDCSAKYAGSSLNDQVLKGPDLMNNLVGVLLRFREDYVAVMSDVEAMFHQVKVPHDDCDVLRFLWWPNGDLDNEQQTRNLKGIGWLFTYFLVGFGVPVPHVMHSHIQQMIIKENLMST